MAQNSEAVALPTLLQQSVHQISDLIARGQRVAFGLMTINHATAQDSMTANLTATHLFQIAGVSIMLKELIEVGSRFKDPISPLFNSNGVQDAMTCVHSFLPTLESLETILQKSDQHVSTGLIGASPAEKVDSEWQLVNPLPQLVSCLHQLTLLVSVGKSEQTRRLSFGDRSPSETCELQRLILATRNLLSKKSSSALYPSGVLSYQSQLPQYAQPPVAPQKTVSIKELQHPRGFRGRYGDPDYPFLDMRPFVQLDPAEPFLDFKKSFEESELERYNLSLQRKYPNTAMFGCWPPTFIGGDTVQEREVQSLFTDLKPSLNPVHETIEEKVVEKTSSNEDTNERPTVKRAESVETQSEFEVLSHADAAFHTPGSTRDSTPTVSPGKRTARPEAVVVPPSEVLPTTEPKEPDSGSKSDEHTPVAESFNTSAKAEDYENETLEACILSPHAESVFNAIEWSSRVERLPLSQAQIQARLDKLSPEYSVMDTISTLSSEEWRSIADYTKPRGTLLSIEKSHKVTMPTKFGTFDITSLTFIVKVVYPPTHPNKASFGFRNPFAATTTGLFGNPQSQTQTGGLFGTSSAERQNGGLFGTRTAGGLFGNSQLPTQTTGLFGQNRPFGAPGGGFGGFNTGTGLFGGSQPLTQPTGLFNTAPTTQTGFGATTQTELGARAQAGFGATAQAGFGTTAQTGFGTATSTRPFGTSITNTSNTNASGNPVGAGLFGAFQQPQNEPQESLFSGFTQRQTAPQPSLFGSTDSSATQRPSLFSGFGASSQSQAQPTSSPFSTLVGQQEQTQTGATAPLFSNLEAQTQTSASPFSSFWSKVQSEAQPPTSPFSNPTGQAQRPSPFTQATTQPRPLFSLFGQPTTQAQAPSLFGQNNTQTQPTPSLFSNVTNQAQTSSPFAASTTQPQSAFSLFGQPTTQAQATPSLFGEPTTQVRPTSLFGQLPQTQTQPQPQP
ncbi:hypothetical protein AOQ84DRAFT_387441, partial [Glonium stellatum]